MSQGRKKVKDLTFTELCGTTEPMLWCIEEGIRGTFYKKDWEEAWKKIKKMLNRETLNLEVEI